METAEYEFLLDCMSTGEGDKKVYCANFLKAQSREIKFIAGYLMYRSIFFRQARPCEGIMFIIIMA